MSHFWGGLTLGLSVGVSGVLLYLTMTTQQTEACGDACGDGTECVDGRCEVVEAEAIIESDEEPTKGKRKKKGRRGSNDGGSEEIEGELAGAPAWDDDSNVPRFNADSDQVIGMSDGSERLSDSQIDRELAKLDDDFQACVRAANNRVAELGTGTVSYSFGVAASGKVSGVNASAPSNLKDAGIIPCVRKAVYGHRFPSFDGPTMKASSSFAVR